MVVTVAPWAWAASMVQDLTLRPSTWTTQAPHWLVSQPTWVPVMPRMSRRSWTRSVRGSISRVTDRSEEHTSELQSLMRISYAFFFLKKKNKHSITFQSNTDNQTSNLNTQPTT